MLDAHSERREEQVSAAQAILADCTAHDDATLLEACETILAHSSDPCEREGAFDLREFLKPGGNTP